MSEINEQPHRRLNILTKEWVLVSPHRTKRPWQGKSEAPAVFPTANYDENCYLCPENQRANGSINPNYTRPFAFTNDFAALMPIDKLVTYSNRFLNAKTESGICRVICFSNNHSLTLPLMPIKEIALVVALWQEEYRILGENPKINHVQIFENKGATMGCSNPHPHGQIWAQASIPGITLKKTASQDEHFTKYGSSLLGDYLVQELKEKSRVVYQNQHFVALVPYWAVWPYEIMLLPKRHLSTISQMDSDEVIAFAEAIKVLTTKYDNVFKTSFPYSSGIHQAPTDGKNHEAWHFHMSFYPPLLRSATVKKFMVGYELFADPQRDITAEQAAETLRNQPQTHYTLANGSGVKR